jgi:chromosome partitioning protein
LPEWLRLRYGLAVLIVFSNTKGGVGKSVLAAHLTLWLFDRGVRVALLDTDPQQTAARWIGAAEPSIPVVAVSEVEAIQQARKDLLQEHQVVVADSPGSGGDTAHTITLLADLVIVPLQPSKPDVRAIKDALKFVRLAQEMSGGSKPDVRLVLTFTAKSDVQTRRLRQELVGAGLPVAVSEIRRLNAFRDACDNSVTRQPNREAAEASKDIEALFAEIVAEKLKLGKSHSTVAANG